MPHHILRPGRRVVTCAFWIVAVVALATRANAAFVVALPLADDRDGGDPNGSGIYNYLAPQNAEAVRAYIGWTGQPTPYDLRAAWEYSLASIPAGSTINSAVFTPKLWIANGSPGSSFVTFHGYNGNGAVDLADVVSTNNPLKTWDMFSGNFATDVAMYVQGLVNNHATYVGIMAKPLNGQIAFDSKENTVDANPAATLLVSYTVPEPGSAGIIAAAGIALLSRRRPRPGRSHRA